MIDLKYHTKALLKQEKKQSYGGKKRSQFGRQELNIS
jgi:hypothetical protein